VKKAGCNPPQKSGGFLILRKEVRQAKNLERERKMNLLKLKLNFN